MTNITINANDALFGGGLYNSGQITVANSIIANSPNGGDCSLGWMITSLGHNLGSDGSCGLTATGDITNTNPLLGSLKDNGGPTLTHALLKSSPALDAGDNTICQAPLVNSIDQRGITRLQGEACDIGAFEEVAVIVEPPVFFNYIPFVRR